MSFLNNLIHPISSIVEKIEKRKRWQRTIAVIKYSSFVTIIVFFVFSIIFLAFVYTIKPIYDDLLLARSFTIDSIAKYNESNYTESKHLADRAYKVLLKQEEIITDKINKNLFFKFPQLREQGENSLSLISGIKYLTQTLFRASDFSNKLTFASARLPDSSLYANFRDNLEFIYEETPELIGLRADIELSLLNLYQAKTNSLLFPFTESLFTLQVTLNHLLENINNEIENYQLVPHISGYPNSSRFIIAHQDSRIMRSSGGKIFALSLVTIKDGEIRNIKTEPISVFDFKNLESTVVPLGLFDYMELVDINSFFSNWSTDWNENSVVIADAYYDYLFSKFETVPDKYISGVITLDSGSLTDIVNILDSGPTTNINDNNQLVEKMLCFSDAPNYCKDYSIFDEYLQRIIKNSADNDTRVVELLSVVGEKLAEKSILVNIFKPFIQNIVDQKIYTFIPSPSVDFFGISETSLFDKPINSTLSRGVKYKMDQGPNGLFSELSFDYFYNPEKDGNNVSQYQIFTRVLLPLGVEITGVRGIGSNVISLNNEKYEIHSFFLNFNPGERKNVQFKYKLPNQLFSQIRDVGAYNLHILKQPNNRAGLRVDLSFDNDIRSYSPVGLYADKFSDNDLVWETNLNEDREFKVRFSGKYFNK